MQDDSRQPAADRPRVLRSIEAEGGAFCVDLFLRPDGSYGFEHYRRDPEAGGWFPVAHHREARFATEAGALEGARAEIPWLSDRLSQR